MADTSLAASQAPAALIRATGEVAHIDLPPASEGHLLLEEVAISYGSTPAVGPTNLAFPRQRITAIIGPSGCGKSTLLRALNRLPALGSQVSVSGRVLLDGRNIYAPGVDATDIRRRVGLLIQQPNPLRARTIQQNVSIGLELNRVPRFRRALLAERALRQVALWDEVKDRLDQPAANLSIGQQQRLCLARTLVCQPAVVLMDEPASALDPIAALRIEELIRQLASEITVIIVTHNMQQAARVSDYTVFMSLGDDGVGRVIEAGTTRQVFTAPWLRLTEEYITGRFG